MASGNERLDLTGAPGRHKFKPVPKDPKRILIRRVDNLGDIVMTLPVFRAMQRAYPHAEITAMAHEFQWGLLYRYADRCVKPLPEDQTNKLSNEYDLIAHVQLSAPWGYKAKQLGTNRKVYISWFTRRRHVQLAQHFLDSLSEHGLDYSRTSPKVYLKPEVVTQAEDWLDYHRLEPDQQLLIGLNAGSKFPYKRWPRERFLRLARWLIKAYDARLVIFSRDRRCPVNRYLATHLPGSKVGWLHGQSAEVAAAVLKRCDLMIGNDSGIGHLASAVGTPTVTIFGPTTPTIWRPAGDDNVLVRSFKTDCLRCGYERATRCKNRVCLNSISAGEVADAVLLSFGRNVGWSKKPVLDKVRVAPALSIHTDAGFKFLNNEWTPRPLMIREGYQQVNELLKLVRKTGSIQASLNQSPQENHLINILALHRIIIPSRVNTQYGLL